jgi:hypothetical protein
MQADRATTILQNDDPSLLRIKRLSMLLGVMGLALMAACSDAPKTNLTTSFAFTKQLGVANKVTNGYGVVTDTAGGIYVAGTTNGALDGIALIGQRDIFVTKYDATGTKLWTKHIGAPVPYGTSGIGIAIFNLSATAANIYVVGSTNGGVAPNTVNGIQDFTLSKLDQTGNIAWTKQFGASGVTATPAGIAVDGAERIYVAGSTDGDLAGSGQMGTTDLFLAQYSNAGTKNWIKQLGVGSATTTTYGVAASTTGGAYVVGRTSGNLDGQTKAGTSDAYVVNYNSAGTKVGTALLGAAGSITTGTSIALESASGAVFIAGGTTAALGSGTQSGSQDMFVARYSAGLGPTWVKQQGGSVSATTPATSLAVDSALNTYVGGSTDTGLDGNTKTGTKDFFLAKYNSSGTKQFTKQLGLAVSTVAVLGLFYDGNNSVFGAGYTDGGLDGWPQTGNQDMILLKYNSLGVKQ